MDKNIPLILSVIGKPDSGKTTLILKLIPELKRKGYKVAVAKHCPRGFDLDVEGKDSWKFTQEGAEGTFLSSEEKIAVIKPKGKKLNIKERLQDYFSDFDIVLMEGYNNESGIEKIQIIRSLVVSKVICPEEIVAYISDMPLNTDKPVYKPDDIPGIISFIESVRDTL
jgi:molybdopterin-guanine dinucleotide biosynthesis protein B